MEKFELSHVVLYAKGWYLKTDDVYEDLKKILNLDGYTPFTNTDVYSILLHKVDRFKGYRWTELPEVLNGIHPYNCWKYGYNVNNPYYKPEKDVEYDMPTAFIYYVLSNLQMLEFDQWDVVTPKLTKYPKAKHITARKVYEMFVLNKKGRTIN